VATRLPPPFPVKLTVEITGDNAEILLPEIEINK
jgi:hypothetical protein